jgi:hypothetical protein
MKLTEKYDNVLTGFISGLLFPFVTGLIIFLVSSGQRSLQSYLMRIVDSDIVTHAITLCVFANIIIFMLFNRFDMLRATRGVLAMTIIWAVIVFGIKIF